jgi:hypothetical protein
MRRCLHLIAQHRARCAHFGTRRLARPLAPRLPTTDIGRTGGTKVSQDYFSIHSLGQHERAPSSVAPSTLGAPSMGPPSTAAPAAQPLPSSANLDGLARLERARSMLTHGARFIDDSDNRATFLDLVRFLDSRAEVLEAMDILADLAASRRADHVRGMRVELMRVIDGG